MSLSTNQRNKIHPHKFALYVGIASIVMMFAGLTSAYIVKSGQPGWVNVEAPDVFWISTAVIILSSITIHLALRSFNNRDMSRFRVLLLITVILGIGFVILQWIGFNWLWENGVRFEGSGAGQFLYIIFGLHALHVLGGIVALIVILMKQYIGTTITYNATPFEVMAMYWHFVDLLWVYLLVFFILIK
ncbi:MAG TPA: heme-copper oxidase subunit III [Flavisolibacter sp.]|nr:heme-copper oxidase subunit III [Flavisolibacter sp.]